MNEKKEITCIVCPAGCRIQVDLAKGEPLKLSGYKCKRGIKYASDEVTAPTRILTTTVRLRGKADYVLPVRTREPIPKPLLKEAMKEIKSVSLTAPIKMGAVVLKGVAGTDIDVIASRSWEE